MVLGFKIKENSVYGIDDPVKIKVGIGSLIKDGVKYMGLTNIEGCHHGPDPLCSFQG